MTARKINLLEFGILPRGMRQDVAAAYVGVCVAKFQEGVRAGTYPQANSEGVWDRVDLDRYFDEKQKSDHSDPFQKRAGELHGEH